MTDPIIDRIERRLESPGLVEKLAETLPASDLRSLLLAVYARRAEARSPAAVLADYGRDRFVRPSPFDARRFHAIDRAAEDRLPPGASMLELSPLAPLGSCSALATVHQNKVVSALRGEVAADATNTLALEAALRRRTAGTNVGDRVQLFAHQRVTRAQHFEGPVAFAHFRTLCAVTAGRDGGDRRFERESLCAQLRFFAEVVLDVTQREASALRLAVTVLDEPRFGDALAQWREGALREALPVGTTIVDAPERESGRGYYQGFCFKLLLQAEDGEEGSGGWLELGDGGLVDWTQQLLGSRKERCLIGGLGSDRLASLAP